MTAAFAANRDPPWTPGSLREHLRAIPPERAEAATRLLSAGDRLIRETEGIRLELRPDVPQQPPHATTVVLTHAHGRISLVITAEHGSGAIGDRTWQDFDGDSRLLAWSLAYEPLLAELSELFGVPLLPVELLPAPASPGETWHWLGLRFDRGESSHCEGMLGLDRSMLDAAASAEGWARGGEGASRLGRNDVPLSCRLRLPTQVLQASTLKSIQSGDVLIVGHRSSTISALRLNADTGLADVDTRYAWAASAETGGITVTRALTEAELRNDTMNQDPPVEATDAAADVRDAIPIRVELLLDTLELSLTELERIGAGQVLSLAQPVDGARVVLRANGKAFGSGELVSLGELLGVKVTRIGDQRGL